MAKVFCPVNNIDDFKSETQKEIESDIEELMKDGEVVATCNAHHDCEKRGNYNLCKSNKVCPHARYSLKENM